MDPMAALNRREEKNDRSSIGWLERFSQKTKNASTTIPPPTAPKMSGDDQVRFGASMIPHNSSPMPTTENTTPHGSGRRLRGFFESGTNQIEAASPKAAMGTFTRKTDPHQKWARSHPPNIGPSDTPIPVVPDQIPMARALSRSLLKTLVRIDRDDGMIAAPPIPMNARDAINVPGERLNADAADPMAKSARPTTKMR